PRPDHGQRRTANGLGDHQDCGGQVTSGGRGRFAGPSADQLDEVDKEVAKMFRNGFLVLLAAAALFAAAAPAWADNDSDAKTAFALSRTGVDARALAMGGAAVGYVNDATAGYWNPAGLNMMPAGMTSLTAMYTTGLSADRFHNYIAGAHRFNRLSLGGSWVNTGIRDVQARDELDNPLGAFGNFENVVIGSLAVGTDR